MILHFSILNKNARIQLNFYHLSANNGIHLWQRLLAPAFELPAHQLHLTNLADAVLAHKLLNVQMNFLQKQNVAFEAPIFVKINLMIMVNGWMVGKPAVNVMQVMTGVSSNWV
jgi:hypothetical protein